MDYKNCRFCINKYTTSKVHREGNYDRHRCRLKPEPNNDIRLDGICDEYKRNDDYIRFLDELKYMRNEE